MKLKRILIFLLGIAFLIFCSFSFKRNDRTWKSWLKGEAQQYYGNINIWHVKDGYFVKLPLEEMLKRYEKNNFGIFVNVIFLNREEAKAKMEQGEYPDIVIFSQNIFENPQDELLELPKIETPYINAGKSGNRILAYPLCFDTYSVIINDEIVDEMEDEVSGVITPENIVNNMLKLPFKKGVKPLCFRSSGAVLSFLKSIQAEAGNIPFEIGQLHDFAKGKVAVLVCGSKELEQFGVELPSNSEYKFGGYTDRVMFLSVYNGEDKNRVKYSKEIVETLMSENLQKKIEDYAFSGLKSTDESVLIGNAFKERPDDEKIRALINDKRGELLKMVDELY